MPHTREPRHLGGGSPYRRRLTALRLLVERNSLCYGRLSISVCIDGWQQILHSVDPMDDVAKVHNRRTQGVARFRNGVMRAGKGQAIPVSAYPANWFEVQVDRHQFVEYYCKLFRIDRAARVHLH